MKLIFLATALAILSIPTVFKAATVTYYAQGHSHIAKPVDRPQECPCTIKIDTDKREIVIVRASDSTIGEFFTIDSFKRIPQIGGDSAIWCHCTKRKWGWRGKTLYDHLEPVQVVYQYGSAPTDPFVWLHWTNGDSSRVYRKMTDK